MAGPSAKERSSIGKEPCFGVDAGYYIGVTALPANEATVGVDAEGTHYTFPVAQYDHNGPGVNVGDDFVWRLPLPADS